MRTRLFQSVGRVQLQSKTERFLRIEWLSQLVKKLCCGLVGCVRIFVSDFFSWLPGNDLARHRFRVVLKDDDVGDRDQHRRRELNQCTFEKLWTTCESVCH